eukprot:TRINITY_DN24137_c0_g1_i1.p1 TRINITY_DN24137_c0_g1~~TRINITY_DN24137_c0_g1_i1.p1  ORF type:complete len:139 (+),score=32.37 TRINITY_DN24137_c0_g1_i1:436-852(+)
MGPRPMVPVFAQEPVVPAAAVGAPQTHSPPHAQPPPPHDHDHEHADHEVEPHMNKEHQFISNTLRNLLRVRPNPEQMVEQGLIPKGIFSYPISEKRRSTQDLKKLAHDQAASQAAAQPTVTSCATLAPPPPQEVRSKK